MVKIRPNDVCWCGSGRKFKKCHSPDRGPLDRAGFEPVRPGVISPRREVPASIPRPDYVLDERALLLAPPDPRKTQEQVELMRRACAAAARVLHTLEPHVRPGVTTDEIDAVAHDAYVAEGGYPSPLGYRGYRKSIETSVNEVICHGIPDSRPLRDGDIVNCDVTIFLDGMHGDTSATYLVGDVDADSRRLVDTTKECLRLGIEAAGPGRPVNVIGRAIEDHATARGYGVVRAFVGHGIGERFHMEPQVKHYYDPGDTFVLEPGMTLTIEPMITMGTWQHMMWDDGWTAVTADLRRTAQFEHTILITPSGREILTLP